MESRDSVTRVGGFTWICPQPSNWLAMEIKMGKAIFVTRGAYETLLGNFRANSNAKGRRSFLLLGHTPPLSNSFLGAQDRHLWVPAEQDIVCQGKLR